jgi:curved DNA-binding protein CbpA
VARRDHYLTLGVARGESARGIKAAYRERAKQVHPDVAGQETTGAFCELTEAYTVLSDPERRVEYDRQLRRAEHRPEPEPLIPSRRRARAPGARLDYQLLLSREEARSGCVVPIRLSAFDVVVIRVPSRTPSGSIFRISIEGLLELRLHVCVSAA